MLSLEKVQNEGVRTRMALLAASTAETMDLLPTFVYLFAVLIAGGLLAFGIKSSLRRSNDQDKK